MRENSGCVYLVCELSGVDHHHGAHPRGEGDGHVRQQAHQPRRILPFCQQVDQPRHPLLSR